MKPPSFESLTVERPDMEALRGAYASRQQAWAEAESAGDQLGILHEWDAARRALDTAHSLASIHFTQDTRDAARREEKEFFDDVQPDIEALDLDFVKVALASPWRGDISEVHGPHLFNMWELSLRTLDPRLADAKRALSKLDTEYSSILAGISVEVDGKAHTLSQVRALLGDGDRGLRLRAATAMSAAIGAHAERLDSLFDEMVRIRDGMGRALGYESFTPLGYELLYRTGYGPDEVAVFREQIREHIVPLATAVNARRAERLGLPHLSWADEGVPDLQGVPKPMGDGAWLVGQGQRLYDALGTDFGAFFKLMRERGLMDLESREGKSGGGYCDGLSSLGVPFIFANFNGTQSDVDVFTHECGHAFQFYKSARSQPLRDYFWPTMEAAEVCSMSLEYLSYPHMELFFGDDAERYRVVHLEEALTFLPYGALVDHFQHEVYARPQASPEDRAATWSRLESVYQPDRRYEGTPYLASGRYWQRQLHIYSMPFYYIDYCLALTCALQLWDLARRDRPAAMAAYRRLATLGGSLSFSELVAAAGLQDPMKPGTLEGVVDTARSQLGL
ncbi:MAG: M3 family oligoendopeptidase [Alphaproteobacteria bacterium]|nr:M3 family oligoendopeptidase [Alphaproteobacteria bacterium]